MNANTAAQGDLFGASGPNAPKSVGHKTGGRPVPFSLLKKIGGKSQAVRATQFLSLLRIPEGKKKESP